MNLFITALGALSWVADPLLTYTIQISHDLENWKTLPFVIESVSGEQTYPLDLSTSPVFARLRYSDSGDTNENGLPDTWEWETFGDLDIDPQTDPDGDGESIYQEWLNGTDPLDFFNGDIPVIQTAHGSSWQIEANEISQPAIALTLYQPDGKPWPNAPVTLRTQGLAKLLVQGDPDSLGVNEMAAWTDHLGRINPLAHAIPVLSPSTAGTMDTVRISAGLAESTLNIYSVETEPGNPPRNLTRKVYWTGDRLYSWDGSPEGASSFIIEEQDENGAWYQVARINYADMPEPDHLTGRYEITILADPES